MYQSYQQLANIYDHRISKASYWDRFHDEQLPTHEQMQEYITRSGLSVDEVYDLFEEWFDAASSHKDIAMDVADTWKEQFDRWFD